MDSIGLHLTLSIEIIKFQVFLDNKLKMLEPISQLDTWRQTFIIIYMFNESEVKETP